MNRSTAALLVVGLAAGAGIGIVPVFAKDDPASVPSSAVTPPPMTERSPVEKKRDEIRARLDGTEWTIELRPMEEGAGKPQSDTLTFTTRSVTSARLTKAGYGGSNYSLNLGEDGAASWETMQTAEGKGSAFWKGELSEERVRGVLSEQSADGKAQNFTFNGTQTSGPKPAASAAAPEEAAPSTETAPEASAAPAPSAPEPVVSQPAAPEPAQPAASAPPAPKTEKPAKKKGLFW